MMVCETTDLPDPGETLSDLMIEQTVVFADGLEIDITPVDFAAKAFVEIGQMSQGAKHTWHIANNWASVLRVN